GLPRGVGLARDETRVKPEKVADFVHSEHALVEERHAHQHGDGGPHLPEQPEALLPARQDPRVLKDEKVQQEIDREAREAYLPQKVRDLRLPDLIAVEVMRVRAFEAGQERRRYIAGPEAERRGDR